MEATPRPGIILGFQQCANLVGDDMTKVRNKFQGFVKKLDITNNLGTRMKAVKELDQYIQKRQGKLTKATTKGSHYKENTTNAQLPVYYPGMRKYEMPFCLSIAILKLKDLIFEHQKLKKEYQFDVENFVMRCLLHQRCLIYKMPNFILYFLDQVFPDTAVKLNYLQIVTHDSQEMDPAFNQSLFLVLLKSIDFTNLKAPISSALSFVQGIFSNHASTFNETQTMQMLLRVTLAGIKSMQYNQEHPESAISQEVFQILQHFLKYNDYSPKLFNICLFTMCMLSNRDQLSVPTLSVLNNLIMENPTYIFQEVIDLLKIQSHLGFWEKNKDKGIGHHHGQQVGEIHTPLRKEIIFKCFKGETLSSSLEFMDLQEAFSHTSSLLCKPEDKSPYTKKTSLYEIVCLNECFTRCIEHNQWTQIQELESSAQSKLKELMPLIINILENDRQQWILSMEKNFERIQRGAIYFAGKSLWGSERIENLNYPINQVLKFYNQQITPQSRISLILELVTTVKHLIQYKGNNLYYEWQYIISILNSCLQHSDQILQKPKCQQAIADIFSYIKQLMMKNEFPDFSEGDALKCYFEYKDKRIANDKSLTQYSLRYLLENYFLEYFERLRVSCLVQEKNQEIRTLFLDTLQDFYSEQVDSEICILFEALFTNNMESFYISRGEYALTTPQMIQIIDILAYIAHKTEKAAYFKHVIEILQSSITFYDYDSSKQGTVHIQTDGGIRGHSQSVVRKEVISNIPHENLKMKSFQNHALNRLIQLFVLKGSNIAETEKSVYLYNILLKILKVSYNDRKKIICDDFLTNLRVNSYRELCWKTEDNPLFIEIQTKYLNQPSDFAARQSCDSQGNSSGGSSEYVSSNVGGATTGNANQRTYNEQNNAAANRTSFDKLGQDKQLIQNTLRALIHTFEDAQTDPEIKKGCLKQFHKFVAYVCDEDFQNVDLEGPHNLAHLKQNVIVDSKVEWIKMVMNLVHSYRPVEQPDYAILMIDIFYSIISLENNFKILSHQQVTHLVEKLIETLYLISGYLKQRRLEYEQQMALQKETMAKNGGKASSSSSNASRETMQKQTRLGSSFVAGDQREMMGMMAQGPSSTIGNNENDETQASQSKSIIIIIKKIISTVSFIFQISSSYGSEFWNQNVIEGRAYILSPDFQMQGSTPKPVVPQVKMIEYFIDQVTALIMNSQTMYKISDTVIICIRNIACAICDDPNFLVLCPNLADSLIFMMFRIVTPFMQNQAALVDPVSRLKNSTQKMQLSLKKLFSLYFSQLSQEDNVRLYLKHFQKRSEAGVQNQLQMQIILDVMSRLIRLRLPQADDTIIKPILTLIASLDEELTVIKQELELANKAQSPEFLAQEEKLRGFLDIIGQNLMWVSHSVYDRHCSTKLAGVSGANQTTQLVNHYIMDNNLVSMTQIGTRVELIVRSASYNYRSTIDTQNMLQQSSEGYMKQISKLRNALMWQAKGKDEQQLLTSSISLASPSPLKPQQIILYDATLLALFDHSSHYERKWGKIQKSQNDKNPKAKKQFFKSKKDLLMFPDEPKFRGWLTKALEKYPPKNVYGIEVSFVDRESKNLSLQEHGVLLTKSDYYQGLSENYLTFLTMLGAMVSVTPGGDSIKGTNHALYLKHLIKKEAQVQSPVNLLISEDETNYIYYVSNVLVSSKEALKDTLSQTHHNSKIHVIYNESNHQNFTSLDTSKIFIVVTKLNETQYYIEIQSQRKGQSLSAYDSYFDPSMHSKEAMMTEPLKDFKNGHLSSYAIVSQEKIGQWIKNMIILSDACEKNQRHVRTRECITSNIMQRAIIIEEVKEIFLKQGKTATILKQ